MNNPTRTAQTPKPNEDPMTTDGYMKNAQGDLVREENVKPEDKLENELVLRAVDDAKKLRDGLSNFKHSTLTEAHAFKALIAEKYGAKKGGAKGNMTLRSFDGSAEIQVAVSDSIQLGPEINAAKELIDDCVLRWSDGANENLQVMVNQAFQVNKEGRIDTHRVLALRRLEITDPDWKRAMEAISDAVRITSSKTYLRFYETHPETGVRNPVSLDLAAL